MSMVDKKVELCYVFRVSRMKYPQKEYHTTDLAEALEAWREMRKSCWAVIKVRQKTLFGWQTCGKLRIEITRKKEK